MDTVRTFVAIELPADVLAELERAQRALQLKCATEGMVKWVQPAGIHLTLKFLGDTPIDRIEAIQGALAQAAASVAPFSLALAHAGCFPNSRQPRVVWIGISGAVDTLNRLQAAVEQTVSPLGFPSEQRRFSPHLTLGRVRDDTDPAKRRPLGDAISTLRTEAVSFAVSSVSLMRSDLRPDGAVYTQLASLALARVELLA